MKKMSVILAVLFVLSFAGCASSGGSSGGGDSGPAYSVDLSTVKVATWTRSTKKFTEPVVGVKNTIPFGAQYDGALFVFEGLPDVKSYARVTIKVKYFDADDVEIKQDNGNAMVVMYININGDLEGPEMGAGRNTPLKEFNLGGFSGDASTAKGSRIFLKEQPGGLLIQCSTTAVKFIELTEVTFHG